MPRVEKYYGKHEQVWHDNNLCPIGTTTPPRNRTLGKPGKTRTYCEECQRLHELESQRVKPKFTRLRN